MNDKYKVKLDTSDNRYVKLRKAFKDEISEKLECHDYDKVIEYIFRLSFEVNKTKDELKKEMDELFGDKSDYFFNFLIKLLDKFYGSTTDQNSTDILEEIYEDKPSNSKGLSSQVVKPSGGETKSGKSLYGQAIDSVKENGRRRQNYSRNKYDSYDDNYNNYRDQNNYRRNRGNNRHNMQRRKNSYSNYKDNNYDRNQENINVGGRNLIIKRRRDSKNSPSRSRSKDRDMSKERERNNNFNNQNSNIESNRNEFAEGEDYHYQNYQGEYLNENKRQYINSNYYQPRPNDQRFFNPRRLGPFVNRGRFPTRFVKQRFLGLPRMPMMRKPLFRKVPHPAKPQQGEQTQAPNTEENNNQQTENTEPKDTLEDTQNPQVTDNNVNPSDDKTNKKKIRCRNWPNCKSENCEYAHPTETCQYFPKCQFGNKCLYIHPNIPCKYGFYCTRLGCSYSHGSGYNPGMFGMVPHQVQHFNSNKFKNRGQAPPKALNKGPGNSAPANDFTQGEIPIAVDNSDNLPQIQENVNQTL